MNSLQWLLSMETFFWGLVLRWKLLYNANFYFAISLSFLMFFLFFILTGFRDYSQSLPSHWYWACWKYHRMISHDSLQARLTERIGHWFQIVVKNYLYLYNVAANSHIQLEDFYYNPSAQNSYCTAGTPRSMGIRPQDISRGCISHVPIFEGRIFDYDYFHLLGKELSFLISFYGDCINIF